MYRGAATKHERRQTGGRAFARLWLAVRRAIKTPSFWSLLACLVVIIALWDSPLLQPLKWLAVLFHELSHALMGWLTGGRLISLNVTEQEGGICRIAGGNRTLILLAGYPGSLCWGLAAMKLARHGRWVKPCLYLLGVALALAALIYIRPIVGFGFLFSIAVAATLPALAHYAPDWIRDVSIRLAGMTSAVYVLEDIQQDVFQARGEISDAMLLAHHTGVPGLVWGIFWYVLALALILCMLLRPASIQE